MLPLIVGYNDDDDEIGGVDDNNGDTEVPKTPFNVRRHPGGTGQTRGERNGTKQWNDWQCLG